MEAVLFDLYIAEGEINANYALFSNDSARKRELLNSVFEKHKITEEVFDSSLAWYAANLEKYFKINENLNKQFSSLADTLKTKRYASTSSNVKGDVIYMPVKQENFFLTSADLPQNVYTFEADTALSRFGGMFEVVFGVLGITDNIKPTITFTVCCTDTTFVERRNLDYNGLFASSIRVPDNKLVEKLYGSIYFSQVESNLNLFIYNFNIFQHKNPPADNKTLMDKEAVIPR